MSGAHPVPLRRVAGDRRIRVLIVDDSATVRALLTRRLKEDGGIEVVGTAANGEEGLSLVKALEPDVITLDFEMPKLDGLSTLQRLMRTHPTPVVMVSSHTTEGAELTLRALELGAVDFIAKPSSRVVGSTATTDELIAKVYAAAGARVRGQHAASETAPAAERSEASRGGAHHDGHRSTWLPKAIVIGSSTGGPQALATLVAGFSPDLRVSIVIVQHMPPGFTRSLAQRLNGLSALEVREAAEGDRFERGVVLIAPGGSHLRFDREGRVRLDPDSPPECGVRPAVNVTMESVVQLRGSRTLGVVLTGMGQDGTRGAGLIRAAGGEVLAQDEATSLIYGMPRVVVEEGYADDVVPLHLMARAIEQRCLADATRRSA